MHSNQAAHIRPCLCLLKIEHNLAPDIFWCTQCHNHWRSNNVRTENNTNLIQTMCSVEVDVFLQSEP